MPVSVAEILDHIWRNFLWEGYNDKKIKKSSCELRCYEGKLPKHEEGLGLGFLYLKFLISRCCLLNGGDGLEIKELLCGRELYHPKREDKWVCS